METPFNITKEEVLELAAQKLFNAYCGEPDLEEIATGMIKERIETLFAASLRERVDKFLDEEMEKLLSQEITPVDIWGEKHGTPTTIRAVLAQRARDFWNVKLDSEGRECHYGTARHEILFKKIVKDEFDKAVKGNIEVMVGAFKEALKADAATVTAAHIDKLITLPRR